ncbi:hypothetical protein HanXRQr2_Chr15g0681251 [Helianthus annuus]|uniref:Uncharacterized protein n=1 Tax=Helianthus annuus TaxID=4232 RepID=A0A9K3H1C8_HELAN|nr:hypothetical protein HanXRQr2_Chr15g0681251 [Helianthus annuus]KAJ0472166.1 hypothetical protein HanHA89_Chr15g0603971 [Helianthus annuus]
MGWWSIGKDKAFKTPGFGREGLGFKSHIQQGIKEINCSKTRLGYRSLLN